MIQSNALAELTDLINQSHQELQALIAMVRDGETLDLMLTTQMMRTLHAAKGISNLAGLPKSARIIHELETIIDGIAKKLILLDEKLETLLTNSNNLLANIIQSDEITHTDIIERTLAQLHEYTKPQATQKQSPTSQVSAQELDYHAFGIDASEQKQLTEAERAIIHQLFDTNQPIIGYCAHFTIDNLDTVIKTLIEKIGATGKHVATLPVHSKLPQFPYAFVLMFTSTKNLTDLQTMCTQPGKITRVIKGEPVQEAWINFTPIYKTAPSPEQKPASPVQEIKQPEPQQKKAQFVSDRPAAPTKINFDLLEQLRWAKKDDPLVHIPISKIDVLIDHNNRLISSKIKLERLIKKVKAGTCTLETTLGMEEQIHALEKHLKLAQQAILNARLIPAETIFSDLGRMVQSIAQETGKKIVFEMIGKEIEIDKSILEGLQNPILHLMKNAADHAIKSPDERTKLGKTPEGHIRITFQQQGENVLVSIEDDGQGLDVKAIKKKAIEKGLIDTVKASQLSDKEIYQYIFSPGFSTKTTLTETSGRGIGMNSVKTAITKMHGELFLESEPGKGTVFTISIPSFLSIQRVLRFTAQQNHYAIPFSSITEVLAYDKNIINKAGNKQVCMWKGKSIEAFSMDTLLGVDAAQSTPHNIIIIRHSNHVSALLVDHILGQEEIIVRPLDLPDKKEFELYTGHADFGDDKLVLIINVDKLWEVMHGHEH